MVETTARELEGVRAELAELRAAKQAAEEKLAAALDRLDECERRPSQARRPARSRPAS
jgi:chromosome segregation ATPase